MNKTEQQQQEREEDAEQAAEENHQTSPGNFIALIFVFCFQFI